jgi:hypothetical protein
VAYLSLTKTDSRSFVTFQKHHLQNGPPNHPAKRSSSRLRRCRAQPSLVHIYTLFIFGRMYLQDYMLSIINLPQYAAVPQADVENDADAHVHNHDHTTTPAAPQEETLAQTIAGVFKPRPHTHCEVCDALMERRERRNARQQCCITVAATFMILFFCSMILGIVIAKSVATAKSHN